ncbi:hypothetical protein ACWCQ1_03970 [Streptomyces sp. NPDC002144]
MTTTGPDPSFTAGVPPLVTTCGRRIAVRRLTLAPADRPITRVALDVGTVTGGEPGTWAALTAGEARRLAGLLLAQADLADREGTGPSRTHR